MGSLFERAPVHGRGKQKFWELLIKRANPLVLECLCECIKQNCGDLCVNLFYRHNGWFCTTKYDSLEFFSFHLFAITTNDFLLKFFPVNRVWYFFSLWSVVAIVVFQVIMHFCYNNHCDEVCVCIQNEDLERRGCVWVLTILIFCLFIASSRIVFFYFILSLKHVYTFTFIMSIERISGRGKCDLLSGRSVRMAAKRRGSQSDTESEWKEFRPLANRTFAGYLTPSPPFAPTSVSTGSR